MKHVSCAEDNQKIRAEMGNCYLSGINDCGTHRWLSQEPDEPEMRCEGIWIGYD